MICLLTWLCLVTMANLGYLQLKANPGVWQLRLREGRSKDVYRIESVSDSYKSKLETGLTTDHAPVIVNSFEGVTIFPVVSKLPGKEDEDVLEPSKNAKEDEGLWGSLKQTYLFIVFFLYNI